MSQQRAFGSSSSMFFRIALAMIAIFMILVAFLFEKYSTSAYSELDRFAKNRVMQIAQNLEFTLRNLMNYGINMYNDEAINDWITSDLHTIERDIDANLSVNRYILTQPLIRGIYLINYKTNNIYSSFQGVDRVENFKDQQVFSIIRNHTSPYLRFTLYATQNERYLSLLLPNSMENTSRKGYLIILLDVDLMTESLLSSQKEVESRIFVANGAGDIILGESDADARRVLEMYRSGKIRSGINLMAGDRFQSIVNYKKIDFQEFTVFFAEYPGLLGSSILSFRNLMILSCAIVLGIMLVLVFLSIRATRRPYSRLAIEVRQRLGKEMSDETGEHLGKDDFLVLRNGMKYLMENVETLNNSVREHGNIIKREYLIQWVMSGRLSESAERYLRKNSQILMCAHVILAVMRIEGYSLFCKMNNFTRRKIIKNQIENIATKSLVAAFYVCESMDIGGDHLLLLVSRETLDIDGTREALNQARKVIAGVLDTKVAAAMSEILPVAGNLREAYDRTYETSLISFMRGRETVYTANDYDGYLAALEPFGEDDSIQQIIQDVRKGDKAVAATKLDSLFEGLRRLTYDECKFKITTVIYRIVKSFSLTVTLKSFESIEDVVEGFSSLPEIREWIVRIMDQIIEQHQDSFERTFARQDLIFEIIEYFRSHMADPQMSPESISQHVSLSTNYVRRIFKESTGTSLSRYIFEQRVETVKRHLATTDASMTEIAGQAGFLTRSGFFAAFKKATGMTPGAYRDRFRASTVDPVG